MIHIIFYNKSVDALLYGWNTPTLRMIMSIELLFIFIGIAIGILAPKNKISSILIFVVGGIGLLFILKNIIFGLSSDAEILLPFAGEILLVGATIAFCVRVRNRLKDLGKQK